MAGTGTHLLYDEVGGCAGAAGFITQIATNPFTKLFTADALGPPQPWSERHVFRAREPCGPRLRDGKVVCQLIKPSVDAAGISGIAPPPDVLAGGGPSVG